METVKKPLTHMEVNMTEVGMSSDIFTLNLPYEIQSHTGIDASWV